MIVSIHFEDDQKTIKTVANQCLTQICDQYPNSILFGCRSGVCGTCLIEVVSGIENLSPIMEKEQILLDILAPKNPLIRVACQCVVKDDICIRVAS
ncbi:(2Fe-2S)-binding protein [Anabaena cylindrica FACHB-243]|uniref:Ferredoxin n=1 Tax=Anabaena cylindrica (strain ATCC 27899 / PCC 7122) TaxID=272123 RepID=K9ZI81_ANACC|nr:MULTISPECIES: 2Fe-2S iron-sulfur cluster-binding protein [Anabaena]AFZ58474.1 ferredoxin [Anabaena cylindrica PCC 7122]MBD2417304.1 (2Fe-2S)-binding protein [Anabaena cylindrica FACHB-243]MBY5281425.1 (2Fe-2S)-binding protein [Anabaena sp. CCAP 1446/1C]MBY5310184.1 (2Fe-2S)-binding protein [Anabaena sp. CCAP 1446/1C]MCM2410133.1 (2Fe-2S)-binding protein [Anabaena sp. CCAP 1446/1C]